MSKESIPKKYRKQLNESHERIYDIHNLVKRECAIKDELEKFKDFITSDQYNKSFTDYCCKRQEKSSFWNRFRKDKKISNVFNIINARRALVLSAITFLVQQYFQHKNTNDQYKQLALTKYIDETKEFIIKESETKEQKKQDQIQVENLANVRTITTLQLLDENRKQILVNFLIKSKLLDHNNQSLPIHFSLSQANLKEISLVKADLSGADLSGADLSGADLSGADLSGADLSGADLSGADLKRANLRKASLRYAVLKNAKLQGADLTEAHFREANLEQADLKQSSLLETNLVGATLKKADLSNASLKQTELVGADLSESNLGDSSISGSNLMNANLKKSNFKCAFLLSDNLTDSNLENSYFERASFKKTNLTKAKGQNVDFKNAKIEESTFKNIAKDIANSIPPDEPNRRIFDDNKEESKNSSSKDEKCGKDPDVRQYEIITPDRSQIINELLEKNQSKDKPDFSCGPYAKTYVITEKNETGLSDFIGVQCMLPIEIPKDARQKTLDKSNNPKGVQQKNINKSNKTNKVQKNHLNQSNNSDKKYFHNFVWYGEHNYPSHEYNYFQHYVGLSYSPRSIEAKDLKNINTSNLQSIKTFERPVYDEAQLNLGIRTQKDPEFLLKFNKIEDYVEKNTEENKDDLSGFYPTKFQVNLTFIKNNTQKKWTEEWILKEKLQEQLKKQPENFSSDFNKKFSNFSSAFSLSDHNVTSCGTLFSEYKVYPVLPRITKKPSWLERIKSQIGLKEPLDRGVRCVFKEKIKESSDSNILIWFGSGVWEGKKYYHLGTYLNKGQSSADLCFSKDWYCYYVQSSNLIIKSSPNKNGGYDVTKEWLENWRE